MKKIKLAASILALCFLCNCSPAAKDNSRDRDEDSEDIEETESSLEDEEKVSEDTAEDKAPGETDDTEETPESSGDDSFEPVVYLNTGVPIDIEQYVSAGVIYDNEDAWENIAYPILNFDTEDAQRINTEVMEMAEHAQETYGTNMTFSVIQNSDNLLTVLVREGGEMDYGAFHPYVIDVNSGRQLTNEQILDIAGVDGSRIHDLATDAIMDGLNYYYMNTGTYYSNGNPMFVDGEVSLDGWTVDITAEEISSRPGYTDTFSDETLNEDMDMFLDREGNLILTSRIGVWSTGPNCRIYDLNGGQFMTFSSSDGLALDRYASATSGELIYSAPDQY